PLDDGALLRLAEHIGDQLTGAGRLQPLLDDPQVSDVVVNGADGVWVDRGHGLTRSEIVFRDAAEVRALATRLANTCGRRLDDAHPCVDARLPDGTRFHAMLPPAAVNGPHVSFRAHRPQVFDLNGLHAAGSLPGNSAAVVSAIVTTRVPFLVTGGAGSGKSTMLAALLGAVAPHERVIIVEDATELAPRHPHVVSLQARNANVEGVGEIGLRQLVRQALRMRPDRIVIGECRGAEVVELLAALNTGHDGGAGTLHANTASDVPSRLAALALPHGLPRDGLHALIASALRVVIHMRRDGTRRFVAEIALLNATDAERITVTPAWRFDTGAGPAFSALRRLLRGRMSSEASR
ncbi:MAG: TadA family conjugal transfer-associated ATPase, partial [Stackebrandtia sp.]